MNIAELISKYGFPIVAAGGLGYFVYYVWIWATKEIKPVLSDASSVLIALIDRIRMNSNDAEQLAGGLVHRDEGHRAGIVELG